MKKIFWFRRDLRLDDNHGLFQALSRGQEVVPVFIFDTCILGQLEDKSDARVTFIHDEISRLKKDLEEVGSSLWVLHGDPVELIPELALELGADEVFTNRDYEPYARERDGRVEVMLRQKGKAFSQFKDQVIFEENEVVKDSGEPYTVFTPYMKKWKSLFHDGMIRPFPSERLKHHFIRTEPRSIPELKELGFYRKDLPIPPREIGKLLLRNYHKTRDIPALEGTSRLSVHLRFGTISIRLVISMAMALNDKFLDELIWREFYKTILWHFPEVVRKSFKVAYDKIQWRNNEEEFKAWCSGRTGFPLLDAGMRQLLETGFMHNRLRMITANFLTRHLLIDWRWGEVWFAKKMLDFDLSANNGGWQWAAGTGCDAAPYFRIFNPVRQEKQYDPEKTFIRRWIPEYGIEQYPQPIVDLRHSRQRALTAYSKALT